MTDLLLHIGNKNYSSWSFRPWIAMRHAGIPFRESTIWLDEPQARANKLAHSPAGRVPILQDGPLTVWDSLAIVEYVAEKFPDRGLLPRDPARRARVRSLCAEMHSGFTGLRGHFPMNCRRTTPRSTPMPTAVREDLARIAQIFAESNGGFLVDGFTLADAFFAPVVSRIRSYGILLDDPRAQAYAARIAALPAYREWHEAAAREERSLPYDTLA
ncbi:MAG: glutathione S-transferase [Planctomycetota bacterium]